MRRRRRLVEAIKRRRPDRARKLAEAQVAAETARLLALRFQLARPGVDGPKTQTGVESSAHQHEGPAEVTADLELIFGELAGLVASLERHIVPRLADLANASRRRISPRRPNPPTPSQPCAWSSSERAGSPRQRAIVPPSR